MKSLLPALAGEKELSSSEARQSESGPPAAGAANRRDGIGEDRAPEDRGPFASPTENAAETQPAEETPKRATANVSGQIPIHGQLVQTVNSSKGIYSDRSYTVFETALDLRGEDSSREFGFSWRGRYAPGEDFTEDLPGSYLSEMWYRYKSPQGPFRLTLGRHYIDAAAGEQVDGLSMDKLADNGFSLGGFFGFRPDPYDFSFRGEAFSAGVYSAWTDNSTGRSYSRQALVMNIFQQDLDRAYLSWDAGKAVTDTMALRQYLVMDFRPEDEGLNLTNYSVNLDWQPLRDLWVSWRGETYRNIFYDVGSEAVPTDTSATYSSSLSMRYVFSKRMIGRASLRYARRDLDNSDSLSWFSGLDFPDLFDSGADLRLSYSASNYYNAFFDFYDAQLTRQFGRRLTLGLGSKYWRNIAETPTGDNTSKFYALSGNAVFILNDRLDVSCFYEYQTSRLNNGPTLGAGFDRPVDFIGTNIEAKGNNFNALLRWKF